MLLLATDQRDLTTQERYALRRLGSARFERWARAGASSLTHS